MQPSNSNPNSNPNSVLTSTPTPILTPNLNVNPDFQTLNITHGVNSLPHWQCKNAIYHVSFRLVDSMPLSVLKKWRLEREILIENARKQYQQLTHKNDTVTNIQKIELQKQLEESERQAQYLYTEQKEKYLDAGHGESYLRNPAIAKLIVESLDHFDNVRYYLHAWCVMPNHVHVIVEPKPDHDLFKILHTWKSFTGRQANKILGLSGDFWQFDSYNHIIRSGTEYRFQIQYVWNNPEKARIKNWPWRWKIDLEPAQLT